MNITSYEVNVGRVLSDRQKECSMTIEEAIKVLKELTGEYFHHEYNEATQLGIDALKVIKQMRIDGYLGETYRLPSEEEK